MASIRSGASSAYAEGTPSEIARCKVKTVACQGCHVRLGVPDSGKVVFLRCSFCGETTNIQEAQQKEKTNPPKVPTVGTVVKCKRCSKMVGVPKKVFTFQCGNCRQVNVAGALNPSE